MADQIKQIAFKEFSIAETIAGTPFNVQTGATDAYVIKSIEATQAADTADGAITATATVGLTSDFNNGKYVSVGNIAKQGKTGSTGNVIVDSNSTFTIRPTAKPISFSDKTFYVDTASSHAVTGMNKQTQRLEASVEGVLDITTSTVVDRTSVTFASPIMQYSGAGNAGQYQYTALHTNANGVHLKILFRSDANGGTGFEVHNATSGVNYGYYFTNYGTPQWDGSRYIFWYDPDYTRIHYYDLDESTTNLASANTYGGGDAANFYHGRIALGSGTNPSNNNDTFDHKVSDLFEKDGQKYLIWANRAGGSNAQVWMAEIPSTLTNYNASANVSNKKIRLYSGSHSSQTDPFGGTGQRSFGYLSTDTATSASTSFRLTYDKTLARYLVYFNTANETRTYIGTFTQAEYDATSSGNTISTQNSTAGYGLIALRRTNMVSGLGFNNNCLSDVNGRGFVNRGSVQNAISAPAGHSAIVWSSACERYWDGTKLYIASETSGAYQYHVYEIDIVTATVKHVTTSITGAILNYYGRFLMKKTVPSNTTAASRSYTSAPKLTVRISGVHENRA